MEGQLCTEDIGKNKAQFQLMSNVNTVWERSDIIGKIYVVQSLII